MLCKETPKEEKPRPNKKLVNLAVLALCILAVAASLFPRRGQPERLIEFEFGLPNDCEVFEGNLFWVNDQRAMKPVIPGVNAKPAGEQILSQLVTGGPQHVVADIDPDSSLYGRNRVMPTRSGVYFSVVPNRKPVVQPAIHALSAGPRPPAGRNNLGTFAAPITHKDQISTTIKRFGLTIQPTVDEIHICKASPLGGSLRDICTLRTGQSGYYTPEQSSNLMLSGSHVLWTLPEPFVQTTASVIDGNQSWFELSRQDKLMWIDLETGVERSAHTLPYSWLSHGESGVICNHIRSFPDRATDMYYVRAVDGAEFSIGPGEKTESPGWSVEWNGALYWFTSQGIELDRLVAVDLGGSQRRTVFQLTSPHRTGVNGKNLFAWHGSLYCLVSNSTGTFNSQGATFLARLHPDRSDPFEIVTQLPSGLRGVGPDGGYFYYLAAEARPGIMARIWSGGRDGDARKVDALYRIRLPD